MPYKKFQQPIEQSRQNLQKNKIDETIWERKWIWQSLNYPHFFYDEKNLEPLLNELSKNEKKLNSLIINNKLSKLDLEIQNLSDEIINSADIEGETLKRESVRASLRKRLEENFNEFSDTFATKQSDNYANILLDSCLNKTFLSIERLHGWHNALFESGYSGLYKINVASFRKDTMQVVSGKMGKEKIHYEALPAKDIENNMQDFLNFCNHSPLNPYLKSAIAHLYFVIIHPYDDGNGRIARAIANFLLPSENIKFYSLSSQINIHKKEYYELLEKTNRFNEKCDISAWLTWHLKITNLAMENTFKIISSLIFKTEFWDKFKNYNLTHHQQKVLNKILDIGIDDFKGKLNVNKYASIAKVNLTTAYKELDELYKIGCLAKDEKGFRIQTDFTRQNLQKNKLNLEYNEYPLNKKINQNNIEIGIGLNKVDNLSPSKYFYEAVKESESYAELEEKIAKHYENKNEETKRDKECDLVSTRIALMIEEEGFSLSPIHLKTIHRRLFESVFPQEMEKFVGHFRRVNISKDEEIFNKKASVIYGDYSELDELLSYDFMQEKKKQYITLSDEERALNIAKFISNIWQIHPFREGNTRVIAVFTIKYLNTMGFNVNNDLFKEHSKYFRNALVLANYSNIQKGISEDFSYLESFFKKLLNQNEELKPMPKCLSYFSNNENLDNKNSQDNSNTQTTQPRKRKH